MTERPALQDAVTGPFRPQFRFDQREIPHRPLDAQVPRRQCLVATGMAQQRDMRGEGPVLGAEIRGLEPLVEGRRELAQPGRDDAGRSPEEFSARQAMPSVEQQGESRCPLVIRWLLAPGRSYEGAKAAYAPFDRLVDPDPTARQKIIALATRALAAGEDVTIIVNNKAEGSAPQSIVELAREFAAAETTLG